MSAHLSTSFTALGYAVCCRYIPTFSAVPSPKTFVDAAVRVFGSFLAGQLLFHARHPGAKRVAPAAALGLRGLQTGFAGVGFVVGGSALRVQAALL